MPRPRTHDLDDLLDVAEQVATAAGPAGLTLRGLAGAAGVPTGSIYHAFSSKDELLARVWLRVARRFLRMQTEEVEAALAGAPSTASAVEAVARAALTPADFALRHPAAARLFFMQRRDQLFTPDLPDDVAAELESVQTEFTAVLVRLAEAMWQRRDRVAVDTIASCVVDLPGGLMHRRLESAHRLDDRTGPRIDAAARAILALPLPPPSRARTARATRKEHRE